MGYGKRICNHCGRLYDGPKCGCRVKREAGTKYHNSFYDSTAWKAVSRFVRVRDFNMDRLALYFRRIGRPEHGVGVRIYDYVIDASTGEIRRLPGGLVVHHIIPRDEDSSKQYDTDNLISLNSSVHEFIHKLYNTDKEAVQNILREAVKTVLP